MEADMTKCHYGNPKHDSRCSADQNGISEMNEALYDFAKKEVSEKQSCLTFCTYAQQHTLSLTLNITQHSHMFHSQ